MNISSFAALAALASVGSAAAQDCGKLISYGTVPMTQLKDETSEFIPVEIAGVPKLMLLDTGASLTTISRDTARQLKLDVTRDADIKVYDVTGGSSDEVTTASLKIGSLSGDKVQFMVGTPYLDEFNDPRVAGLLGADILGRFDVSIDYGAHTFSMLNQNHCDGQVVYWPERPIAVVPFKIKPGGAIVLTLTLDGEEITAQLDTGAYRSTLDKSKAERTFHLSLGDKDTPLKQDGTFKTWSHRFKTLSFAGLVVNNPEIDIIPDKISEKINTWSTGSLLDAKSHEVQVSQPMLLGMNVLKPLHIYIAYKEKKLYITPAGSPPTPAQAPAPAK